MSVFNMNQVHLEDVEFYLDSRLDNVNIFSIVLVSNSVDFDFIITEFCKRMTKYSCIQMIRQCSNDFCRFTFVSHVNCFEFSKCVNYLVDNLAEVFNCQILIF